MRRRAQNILAACGVTLVIASFGVSEASPASAATCGSPALSKESGSVKLVHSCPADTQVTYVVDCNFPIRFGDFTYSMYFEQPASKQITVCHNVEGASKLARIRSWETR